MKSGMYFCLALVIPVITSLGGSCVEHSCPLSLWGPPGVYLLCLLGNMAPVVK